MERQEEQVLHYRRYGKGPTLVMQHGFLGGSGYWVPHLGAFGRTFDVLAPDLPGFAGSAGEPLQDSLEGLAGSVMRLMDALRVERFHMLGHSMGGMIAQQIALDHPDRVRKLVLYGTAPLGDLPRRFETLDASIARLESEGVGACADVIVPTWFVEGHAAPFYRLCHEAGRGTGVEAAVKALRAVRGWDVRHRLGEIKVPTLVLCGDRDRSIALDQAFALREGIEGSQLCIAPGCAHNVHLEKPELFGQVVREFLLAEG
jgi:pimeloyl-ACP methyl ester carboxylesterase